MLRLVVHRELHRRVHRLMFLIAPARSHLNLLLRGHSPRSRTVELRSESLLIFFVHVFLMNPS